MKYLLKIILLMLYTALIGGAWAQNNLKLYEYWLNEDFENKVVQNITPTLIHELSTNIDVSALSDGVNVFNIRYQDENDIYSATLRKLFVKFPPTLSGNNKLIQYEYWFNNDYNNKIVQSISPTTNSELTTSLNVSILPMGVNVLNFRYLDERGYYSATLRKIFLKFPSTSSGNNKLVQYEYWFNNDFDNKIVQSITPTNVHEFSTALNVSQFSDGVNVLHFRYLDERGNYSTTLSKMFVKFPPTPDGQNQLVQLEYWFNNDYINKHVELLTPQTINEFSTALDVSAFPDGVNVLHLRYKDSRGYYGSLLSKIFIKQPNLITNNKLIAYKYWFDNAVNNAVVTDIDPSETIVFLENDIALEANMVGGNHKFYIQFLDNKLVWSVPLETSFLKSYDPRADLSVDNNPACNGNIVHFISQNRIDVDQMSWNFGDGTPISNVFNPTHVYATSGEYIVTVTMTHNDSNTVNTETIDLVVNQSYNSQNFFLNDDFEDDVVGNLPDGWVIRYNGTGNANQKVVSNPVKNGIKAFQLEGATNWASQLDFTLPELPDNYSVEMWIQAEKILSGGTGGFILFNPANSWGSDIIRVDFFNGFITVFNRVGTSLGTRYYLQPYEIGEWYHVKAVLDYSTFTCKIFINGTQASGTNGTVTVDEFATLTTLSPEFLTLVAGNSGTTKMFFDDVKMYSSHNPQQAEELSICENEIPYVFGTQSLTQSGTYFENFYTEHGCDSIVQLNLTLKPLPNKPILNPQNLEVCPNTNGVFTITNYNTNYTYLVYPSIGVTQDDDEISAPIGSYVVTSFSDNCESEISDAIEISAYQINTNVSLQEFPLLLTAQETGAIYQWIDCTNGNIPINGATQVSYEPTINGSYAVQITKNGCTVTSDCVVVSTVNIADFSIKELVTLYPNPTFEKLNITNDIDIRIQVITANGTNLWEEFFNAGENQMEFEKWSSGLYLVRITALSGEWTNQTALYKIVKL